jgi:diketogulonate reductase-like aldo/keto reductase
VAGPVYNRRVSLVERCRTLQAVGVPSFFYGTAWKEERTERLTALALDAGFRAIDTANQRRHYVEAAVGRAIGTALATGTVTRAELFLQTKFTHVRGHDHRIPYDKSRNISEQVLESFESSLEHLGTTYVDSYLIHGPSAPDRLTEADWEVWRTLGELQRTGRVRLIGISNVSLKQLLALMDSATARPAFVQNRCYAKNGWDREVREFCRAHGLAYQGFSLLTANARELATPAVAQIVERTGRALPQVVFRFALEVGMIPLTGTSNPEHMRQDLECFDFELTAAECAALERVAAR